MLLLLHLPAPSCRAIVLDSAFAFGASASIRSMPSA